MYRLDAKTGALSTRKAPDADGKEKISLQRELELLHRELERKDARNDKLTKELVETRTVFANQEVIIYAINLISIYAFVPFVPIHIY